MIRSTKLGNTYKATNGLRSMNYHHSPFYSWRCGFQTQLHWLLIDSLLPQGSLNMPPGLFLPRVSLNSCPFFKSQLNWTFLEKSSLTLKIRSNLFDVLISPQFLLSDSENKVKSPWCAHISIICFKALIAICNYIFLYAIILLPSLTTNSLRADCLCFAHHWICNADHRAWHIVGIH